MAKTVTELCTRVLERIGTLAAGDTPSTADLARVTAYNANAYQEFERLEIAFWDADSIPEYVFEPLVDYIAGQLSSDDGWPRPELIASGYGRLRLMAAQPATGEVQVAEYF